MKPLVSVIVPIYNVEQYLPRCLDSIKGQTYLNLEIILIDDGSTDNSGYICSSYAAIDNRFHIIQTENCGVSNARNMGLQAASGDYVMFVDSDDRIPREAIQILWERIEEDGTDMAVGKYLLSYSSYNEEVPSCSWMHDGVYTIGRIQEMIGENKHLYVAFWGKLYKKEIWDDVIIPNLSCGEDMWVFPELVTKCKKISVVDQEIYEYCIRKDSITQTRRDKEWLDSARAAAHHAEILLSSGYEKSARLIFRSAIGFLLEMRHRRGGLQIIKVMLRNGSYAKLVSGQPIRFWIKMLAIYVPGLYGLIKYVKENLMK